MNGARAIPSATALRADCQITTGGASLALRKALCGSAVFTAQGVSAKTRRAARTPPAALVGQTTRHWLRVSRVEYVRQPPSDYRKEQFPPMNGFRPSSPLRHA